MREAHSYLLQVALATPERLVRSIRRSHLMRAKCLSKLFLALSLNLVASFESALSLTPIEAQNLGLRVNNDFYPISELLSGDTSARYRSGEPNEQFEIEVELGRGKVMM